MQINWDDKVKNILNISKELNLGLDSFVFADDSEFEIELVKKQLPQVATVHLKNESYAFGELLLDKGYFDSLTISDEDKNRSDMYKSETERIKLQESSGTLEEYLNKLNIQAEIGLVGESEAARVSQLTQKTNQFNLTINRYSEGEILAYVNSALSDVFFLKLSDRIADLGIIGAAIIVYKDDKTAEIDTFLLSCRALGRGAEDFLLCYILKQIENKGYMRVIGKYRPSDRNGQVADFFSKRLFDQIDKEGDVFRYSFSIADKLTALHSPQWISIKERGAKHGIKGRQIEKCAFRRISN